MGCFVTLIMICLMERMDLWLDRAVKRDESLVAERVISETEKEASVPLMHERSPAFPFPRGSVLVVFVVTVNAHKQTIPRRVNRPLSVQQSQSPSSSDFTTDGTPTCDGTRGLRAVKTEHVWSCREFYYCSSDTFNKLFPGQVYH